MRTIKIGFSKPKTFKVGAWLIQKWINKPYSHVYLRYTDNEGRDLIFQAASGLVHQITYTNFLMHNISIKEYSVEFTDLEFSRFMDFYYAKIGLPYDIGNLGQLVVYDVISMLFKITIDTKNWSGYICSELASEMLSKIKDMRFGRPFNLIRPDHIDHTVDLYLNLMVNEG